MVLQCPRIGSFFTSAVRVWSDADMDDVVITQEFDPPYSSAPDILTALTFIDVKTMGTQSAQTTIGIKTSAEEPRGTQFTLRVGVWGDGGMSSNGCNWLEIMPGDARYQFGEFRVTRRTVRNAAQPIVFDTPFPDGHVPNIVVWLSGFQMAANSDWNLSVSSANPTVTGFNLAINVPNAALHQATISWFAYDPVTQNTIRNGTFEASNINTAHQDYTNSVKKEGDAAFTTALPRIPRVIQGINNLQITRRPCITVEAHDPTAISTTGFHWKIGSWGETVCNRVGVSYIAFCDPAA